MGLLASTILAISIGAIAHAAEPAAVAAFTPKPSEPQCRGSQGYAAAFDGRRTFIWRPQWLEAIKDDAAMRREVVSEGDKALNRGPYSVTDKPRLVPGASLNDYSSIGPYWWPDPKKKDGLPYFRRDGEVNPERDGPEFDRSRLRNLGRDVQSLALAYYVSGNEKYADKAASLLRVWFVDPATRMNPNFDFAQGIPGKVAGRGEGIIESSDLSTIVEAIGLLGSTPALTAAEHKTIETWYRDLAVWLATSDNGAQELAKKNNHGVFYDYYLAHFALYAGLEGVTTNIVEAFPQQRLARQMDRRGRFIDELKRTRSWHYAHFIMQGTAKLATLGECVGKDLWTAELPDGRGLANARDFLATYWDGSSPWPFKDINLNGAADKQASSPIAAQLRFLLAPTTLNTGEAPAVHPNLLP